MSVLNIAGYHFVPLADPHALRATLWAQLEPLGIKGTVLLAEEGINLCLAGSPDAIHTFWKSLLEDLRFAPMKAKESHSETVPFQRLLVKVKREIIRMNMPQIRPADERAPAVDAATLARWLAQGHDDEQREVVTLDTRNAFEVDAGAFNKALDWRLERFSDFPAALAVHREELRGKTVVSYCTGGIRCEKAGILMAEDGQAHGYRALQLDGGVLGYFETMAAENGQAPHWHGSCVVFDERGALTPALEPA